VTGERQYSYDLEQGGLELPAEYCFLISDQNLLNKMAEAARKEVPKINQSKNKATRRK